MRIDSLLYEKGLYSSRNKAKESVLKGEVFYKGVAVKPSFEIESLEDITIIKKEDFFVSNGGYKLSKALKDFNVSVEGLTVCDIGASNGGFSHCLLKNNAKKVYAIDVGESQLDKIVANDSRVVVLDNTNARYITKSTFSDEIDAVVCDVSFISLTYILENVEKVLKESGFAIMLIKPQFECGKKSLSKTGIVTDANDRYKGVLKVIDYAQKCGLYAVNLTTAPIKERKNVEYLVHLVKDKNKKVIDTNYIKKIVFKGEA